MVDIFVRVPWLRNSSFFITIHNYSFVLCTPARFVAPSVLGPSYSEADCSFSGNYLLALVVCDSWGTGLGIGLLFFHVPCFSVSLFLRFYRGSELLISRFTVVV